MQYLRDVDVVSVVSVDWEDSEDSEMASAAAEEAVVAASGESQEKAVVAPTAVVDSAVLIPVEDVDVAAAPTSTSLSPLVPVLTTLAVNAVRRSHQKANANGLATGRVAVNVHHLSLNSSH